MVGEPIENTEEDDASFCESVGQQILTTFNKLSPTEQDKIVCLIRQLIPFDESIGSAIVFTSALEAVVGFMFFRAIRSAIEQKKDVAPPSFLEFLGEGPGEAEKVFKESFPLADSPEAVERFLSDIVGILVPARPSGDLLSLAEGVQSWRGNPEFYKLFGESYDSALEKMEPGWLKSYFLRQSAGEKRAKAVGDFIIDMVVLVDQTLLEFWKGGQRPGEQRKNPNWPEDVWSAFAQTDCCLFHAWGLASVLRNDKSDEFLEGDSADPARRYMVTTVDKGFHGLLHRVAQAASAVEKVESELIAASKHAGTLSVQLGDSHGSCWHAAVLAWSKSVVHKAALATDPLHAMQETLKGMAQPLKEGSIAQNIKAVAAELRDLPDIDLQATSSRLKAEASLLVEQRRAQGSAGKAVQSEGNDIDLDRKFMERAVEEARKSRNEDNRVHPKVGVVIVKDGNELAAAYRGELSAGEHAEFTALEKKLADVEIAGATVYTTLEPCTSRNHPKLPCAVRLVERKVKRVVIGMLDPNVKISGKGVHRLREANVAVDLFPSALMSMIEEMSREFIRHHKNGAEPVPLENCLPRVPVGMLMGETPVRRKGTERRQVGGKFWLEQNCGDRRNRGWQSFSPYRQRGAAPAWNIPRGGCKAASKTRRP